VKDHSKPEGTFYNTRDANLTHILIQVLSLEQTESIIHKKQKGRINAIFALLSIYLQIVGLCNITLQSLTGINSYMELGGVSISIQNITIYFKLVSFH